MRRRQRVIWDHTCLAVMILMRNFLSAMPSGRSKMQCSSAEQCAAASASLEITKIGQQNVFGALSRSRSSCSSANECATASAVFEKTQGRSVSARKSLCCCRERMMIDFCSASTCAAASRTFLWIAHWLQGWPVLLRQANRLCAIIADRVQCS